MAPDARIHDDFGENEQQEDEAQGTAGDATAAADAEVDGGAAGAVADGRQRREGPAANRREYQGGGEGLTGLLVDISALLVGFFTSLVPRTPPEANGF